MKGQPFGRIRHDTIEQIGDRFFRSWYHPTKGKRWQRISIKEAMLTKLRKLQLKEANAAQAA